MCQEDVCVFCAQTGQRHPLDYTFAPLGSAMDTRLIMSASIL